MHIDLLPDSVRARIQARGLLRRYAVVWLLVGAAVLTFGALRVSELKEAKRQLVDVSRRCESLRDLQQKIAACLRQRTELNAERERLERLQPINGQLPLLNVLVQVTKSEQGKVQIQRLNFTGSSPLGGSSPSATPAASPVGSEGTVPTGCMSLQGVAEDDVVLARLVAALRGSEAFERVELKSSTHIPVGNTVARQFQVECRYEDGP